MFDHILQTYILILYPLVSTMLYQNSNLQTTIVRKKLRLLVSNSLHSNTEFYLYGVLRCFQHCTGHITMGSWKGRGDQYIQFVRVLYCKLPTNSKQLPAFPLEGVPGTEAWPQRWEARVLPLCHRGPFKHRKNVILVSI